MPSLTSSFLQNYTPTLALPTMEAFTLLKFWKSSSLPFSSPTTTLPSTSPDHGPFFDLQFTKHHSDNEEEEEEEEEKSVAELVCLEDEDELQNDDVELIPLDSTKSHLFPVSLLRSATRLRIFKKPSPKPPPVGPAPPQSRTKKLFTIKFNPGEVPIVSLFTSRPGNGVVSSLSSSSDSEDKQEQKKPSPVPPPPADEAEEKQNPKDGVQKYLKMVKPLYIRVSKRYGEKLGLAEVPGGLKVMVRKRLSGKIKTEEVAVVRKEAAAVTGRQMDDSLVQQQEWIQGAILHCKKSFNSSTDEEETETVLCRSASDTSQEKTVCD